MLIEDSLWRTTTTTLPPRQRVSLAPTGTPHRPVLPLKIHHLPKISIKPHIAIPTTDFATEGAA
jgi:hypothetical protein